MLTGKEQDHKYACYISAGTLLIAKELTRLENNKGRKEKKERVVNSKRKLLREAFLEDTHGLSLEGDTYKLLEDKWPKDKATTFVIDLAFTNPFAPYELKYKESHFDSALKNVAPLVHLKAEDVDRIRRTQREALKAHRHINWKKIALFSLGGLVIAPIAWFAAPLIGGAIGVAAGLSGAAATAHGLAILGGGSLAIGGLGMAGGMGVVTGSATAIAVLGAGGSQFLLQLGAANAKIELIKLQVNYKEVVLGTQTQVKKVQEVIKKLIKQRDKIKNQLEEERKLNEENSNRIQEIKATLMALEDSIKWMGKQTA